MNDFNSTTLSPTGVNAEPTSVAVTDVQYSPVKNPKLDKDLFLAEYKSLRDEILLRITQQTQITGFALTAWGVIIGSSMTSKQYALALLYPLLAFFVSRGWAFNNTRIFQIGHYLKRREVQVATPHWGLMFWENHITGPESRTFLTKDPLATVKPGLYVFCGTESASLLIYLVTIANRIYDSVHSIFLTGSWRNLGELLKAKDDLVILLFFTGVILTYFTQKSIMASEKPYEKLVLFQFNY